ncbi:MAG: hypothetical protein QM768_02065 [Agriterribacter sp.]
MYQVFNMGCRLEVYTTEKAAVDIIKTAQQFGIEAQVIGRVEAAQNKSLELQLKKETLAF